MPNTVRLHRVLATKHVRSTGVSGHLGTHRREVAT